MSVLGAITLPGVERSVGCARRFLRDTVGPDYSELHDLAVVVSELVGNCIKHTDSGRGGKVRILLVRGPGVLYAEVTDDGAGGARPGLRNCGHDAESGRGLRIVDALARWGYRADGVRTTVWAEFPLDAIVA